MLVILSLIHISQRHKKRTSHRPVHSSQSYQASTLIERLVFCRSLVSYTHLNLDYVPEEEYTEELWNEQKKNGERNRASFSMHK